MEVLCTITYINIEGKAVATDKKVTVLDQSRRVRGPQRTTREDWIQTALDTLISDGVDSVKVSVLSGKLDCARSSFYWYFKNRKDLLDGLLDHWQAINTSSIVGRCNEPSETINFALCRVFSCWINDALFDTRLEFAIRDWARRDGSVRRAVDISDDARIGALQGMFMRHGFPQAEAAVRAKIVYFTQIGYNSLDSRDSSLERARTGREYLFCMTGVQPTAAELEAVTAVAGHTVAEAYPEGQ